MESTDSKRVYIISGPAGVGKPTTSKELIKQLPQSAYISGDYVSHMHVNGRKKPWESTEEMSLIWHNILSLTRNFVTFGNEVVIDFVTFPEDAKWLEDNMKDLNVEVNYLVLWTDEGALINRDNTREPEHQMGERCLVLLNEFTESGLQKKNILDTTNIASDEIDKVIYEIMNNRKYKII